MMAGHNHEANAPRWPHTLRRPTMRVLLTTLAVLLTLPLAAAAADKDEKLSPERRRKLEKEASRLQQQALERFGQSKHSEAAQLL